MNNPLYRQFLHRYQKISETSGYELVYRLLELILELIPNTEISMDLLRPKDNKPETIAVRLPVFGILKTKYRYALDLFYNVYLKIPFARRIAQTLKQQLILGQPLIPLGFADDHDTANGIIHNYYKILKITDNITTGGLLNTYQLLKLPETQNYYILLCGLERQDDHYFSLEEKHFFAFCFEIFFEDLKRKIACSESCAYLPYLSSENFKARELACIKACFDLKLNKQPITRVNIAEQLNKQNPAQKTTTQHVDYDLKKIKQRIFNDVNTTTDESIRALIDAFNWQNVAEVFKLYAYFGFYPDSNQNWHSNLSSKMGAWEMK